MNAPSLCGWPTSHLHLHCVIWRSSLLSDHCSTVVWPSDLPFYLGHSNLTVFLRIKHGSLRFAHLWSPMLCCTILEVSFVLHSPFTKEIHMNDVLWICATQQFCISFNFLSNHSQSHNSFPIKSEFHVFSSIKSPTSHFSYMDESVVFRKEG